MAKVVSNRNQMRRLVELMEQNLDVAKGVCSKTVAQKKWMDIASDLNILGPPTREWHKWQRVDLVSPFIEIMSYCCHKTSRFGSILNATGGGPNRLHNFNNLEESVIRMLEIETCVNPPGKEFGAEDENLNEETTVSIAIEPVMTQSEMENSIEDPDEFVQKYPRKPSRAERLQTERKTMLETQTSAQKEFYENMTNIMVDIRKSMKNIEYYSKKNMKQKDEIIQIKTEKLKTYKENKSNKDRDRMAKLKLKIEILEIKKRNKKWSSR